MSVTGSATTSLLDSVLSAQSTRQEVSVEMLKKAQDASTEQGEALIDMLENSVPPADGRLLDAYA